ncbi:hypothetical protein [Streptomyces sp. NPDC000229]|uniref:hypothetical protein n=1 Tax=Streptomyces sp. NPDC000229 TaxID=3154247 RepID=UPI0033325467
MPQTRGRAVDEPPPEDQSVSYPTFPPVSDASCQTMLDVLEAETASASVIQIFNWHDGIYPGGSTLASYDGTKAEQAFMQLRKALTTCKSYTGTGWTGKYTAQVTMEEYSLLGDETLSLRITGPTEVGMRNEQFVIVRVGNTTAAFSSMDVDRPAEFPRELINRQVERLSNSPLR